jgi:multidrug resistance efflux pump
MKHKRPPVPVIVILILAVLTGGYFGIRALMNKDGSALTASGTIEAVEVTISPEIGGRIVEVLVDEGAVVNSGDVLFRLDDTLLQAQRAVASASLDLAQATARTADATQATAQANYDLAVNAARLDSITTRTTDWRGINPAGYTLPEGYFSRSAMIAAAEVEVEAARAACAAAQDSLNTLLADPANVNLKDAETRLLDARGSAFVAQDVLTRANSTNSSDLRDAAQSAYDAAHAELEDAQAAYDDLSDTPAGAEFTRVRAELSVAQERLDSARDRLLGLQTGEDSPKVVAARAVLQQAVVAADQAQLAVAQSQASLALIDAQIAKLTITAPADGTILTNSIQPGETVAPNAAAMSLGRLNSLTITVYVPENLYGELSLGQSATVAVDSFPGGTFAATISHIAEQAEFTPRNVQTIEGRTSTVFAVKLNVEDPGGKLKPGMPADVIFK